MTRGQRILIIVIGIFVAVPLIWWGITSVANQSSNEEGTIVDKDTGETFNPRDRELNTGGSIAKQSDVQLFGIENLSKQYRDTGSDTGNYLTAVKEALWNFSNQRLENKYPTLTVRPQNLDIRDTGITGQVRLGQTDILIPIKIAITPGKETGIVYLNEGSNDHGGVFIYVGGVRNPDELLFTITQVNSTSTDLLVDTIPGYREIALEYIESLGYNVPDFTITFTNYESPF